MKISKNEKTPLCKEGKIGSDNKVFIEKTNALALLAFGAGGMHPGRGVS